MQIPRSFSPQHCGGAFLGVPRAYVCGWIKLSVKTIIIGCASGTREAGPHEPLWGKERACIWQVSGSSLCVCFDLFGVIDGFSPA